jgi:DNA polymerase-1
VWWSARPTAAVTLAARVRLAACWDLAAVHRLLHGGRRGDPPAVWAAVADLPAPPAPPSRAGADAAVAPGQLGLWDETGGMPFLPSAGADGAHDADGPGGAGGPLRDDGQLDAGWLARAATHAEALRRAGELAVLALRAQTHQEAALHRLADGRVRPGRTPLPVLTAWAESAAELLALELERDGLPLARATHADDMYAPVAAQLGLGRPDAKVAMLAAMYGQTSGPAGEALRRMRRAYPTALAFLDDADAAGRAGRDLRTFGGRCIRLGSAPPQASPAVGPSDRRAAPRPPRGLTDPEPPDGTGPTPEAGPSGDAARTGRGRFARNAVVQGPAAELFKSWAATVRAALPALDGEIVLCLHDELLLHVPDANAEHATEMLRLTLAATAAYWSAGSDVRIIAEISILRRWSDASH